MCEEFGGYLMPKISIIVPVYNVEKYLSKCLDSLVNQTLKDIEIIIVNDGSPDSSQSIIDSYVVNYPTLIKSYIKENGGQGSARNLGLEYAKGEYISFVDSDDWLDLDALEKMYNIAIKNNSDIVICDMVDYYEDGTKKIFNCTKYNSVYTVTPSACNKIFKKEIIGNIRFLNKLWYEDFNFTTKILLSNPQISVISGLYYNCHARNLSTMNNNNSAKNLDMITVIDDLIEYAKSNNLYDENIFKYLIFDHILISTINRVTLQKNREKNIVVRKLRKYCKTNINDYKKQNFYKTIPLQRKVIANLNYYGLNNISRFLLAIKSKLK